MFDQVGDAEESLPFYKRNWFIVLALLFLNPVGLVLLWAASEWETKVKVIVTAVSVLLWVGYVFNSRF